MPKEFYRIRPYHIVSRVIDGKEVFGVDENCYRFLFQMYAANIGRPVMNVYRKDIQSIGEAVLKGESIPDTFVIKEHDPLVAIFSFVLKKDHYHIGVVPRVKGGISKYLQKLHVGFAKYFNAKNNRRGSLFENKFKGVSVQDQEQLKLQSVVFPSHSECLPVQCI